MRRLSQSQRTVAGFQSGEIIIGGRALTSISSLKSGLVTPYKITYYITQQKQKKKKNFIPK